MTAVQTCVNILPDIMARNSQNLARDEASASAHGFVYPNGVSHISLYQTGPSRDYSRGSSWNRGRGQQYFHGNSGRSDTQARYPDSFHNVSQAHVTSPDSSSTMMDSSLYVQGNAAHAAQWSASIDSTPEEPVAMSRWASQSSFHSAQGSVHGTDLNDQASSQLQRSLSQMSFPLLPGNPGFQGNSNGATLYSSNPTTFEGFTARQEESSVLFSPTEPFGTDTFESGSQRRTPISQNFRFDMFSAVPEEVAFTPTMDGHPALVPSSVSEASFSSSVLSEQPLYVWDGTTSYPDSAINSPLFTTETWPGVPLTSSPSPREGSVSEFKNLSPRNTRKLVSQGIVRENSNHGLSADTDIYDESSHLTHQSLEMDNVARDHPLYHQAVPREDGLYHCPWEGEATCQHKGEKLKCNYDKFVDSHLKPYRCKVSQCENARFSSTACLLRHEREAHAMHGHGDKPFLCTHDGCERGVPGNGFPRHWNLRDHMKRVHNDTGPAPRSNASGSPTPSNAAPIRAPRKRKNNETSTAAEKEKEQPLTKKTQTVSVAASPPPPQKQEVVAVSVEKPEEPSLVQQWQQRRMYLLQLVQQLDDPKAPGVMQVLSTAGKEIQMLAGTSRRISSAPVMERPVMKRSISQQSTSG